MSYRRNKSNNLIFTTRPYVILSVAEESHGKENKFLRTMRPFDSTALAIGYADFAQGDGVKT